ncbi:MAG: hypothetical protein K8J08_02200 [Thermoanaerobaculia bacterium]|nr:hypothetical protein [Thermoanaerobaculia bacterium]
MPQPPKVMFTTSVNGTGDLSTWTDSGGLVGLAGADAVCRSRAAAAGLANSENFVAWLSDANHDAYCRVHGYSGKKANNCGQPSLPTGAGGWLRTDGYPFTRNIETLLQIGAWVAPRLDEFGALADVSSGTAFTGTLRDGTVDDGGETCSNWSSAAPELFGRGGYYGAGWFEWTRSIHGFCQFSRVFYCFEAGAGPALEPPEVQGAIAFFLGRFGEGEEVGGLSQGDAICQMSAEDGGLPAPSSYMAWLSDDTVDAVDRFPYDGPWIRPDGVLIANNKADLTDGELTGQINVDYLGQYWGKDDIGFVYSAWTGTRPDGSNTGDNCVDWTSNYIVDPDIPAYGSFGRPEFVDSRWTELSDFQGPTPAFCGNDNSFYCFSQVATGLTGEIFADGFEVGNTSMWSTSSP